MSIINWISSLGFPLDYIGYIISGIILLVIIDAFLNLLFSGLSTLWGGGNR